MVTKVFRPPLTWLLLFFHFDFCFVLFCLLFQFKINILIRCIRESCVCQHFIAEYMKQPEPFCYTKSYCLFCLGLEPFWRGCLPLVNRRQLLCWRLLVQPVFCCLTSCFYWTRLDHYSYILLFLILKACIFSIATHGCNAWPISVNTITWVD